jgi:hypothetical protein
MASAQAEMLPIENCNSTLVKSTYTLKEGRFRDWRLAESVDQATYEEIKKGSSNQTLIYGVPMGKSWADFQMNIAVRRQGRQEPLTDREFRNIVWMGLNEESVAAYTACLNRLVLTSKGLNIVIVKATETDVTVQLHYNPREDGSDKIAISWQGAGAKFSADPLPDHATRGVRNIQFSRPSAERATVSVVSAEAGASSFVVLEPVPKF